METLYRTLAGADLEIRSGGDGRTITGIAVPYNAAQRIDANLTEEWLPGAFRHQEKAADKVAFSREHLDLGGALIGKLTMMKDDPAGLYIEARASRTQLGDDTLELVRDGALRDLSIGFSPRPGGDKLRSDGVLQRSKADLREVAVVMQGAFGDLATVGGIRSHGDPRCPRCAAAAMSNMEAARQVIASLPMLPV